MTTRSIAPRARLLVGLWLLTAVLTGLPALLLRSFAEDATARTSALLLLATAGVALAAASFVRRGTRRALQGSLAASVLVMAAAGSALAVLAANAHVGPTGALLFGGVAIGGSAVTASIAGTRLRQDGQRKPK